MRRHTGALLAAAITVLAWATIAGAQDPEPAVEVQPLRGSLHLLQGRGGNVVASVGLDGVLLVDDDYPDLGPAYEEAVTGLTNSALAPGFVLNTHWHGDHTGNNEFWAMRGAVIVAHANVRERMAAGQTIEALGTTVEPSPALALPLVTYGDSVTLHFNGDDVEVQHYPAGHTDGDSVVFFSAENVVHVGDLYFKDGFPFIDLSSGGSVDGYIGNVEKVLQRLDDDVLIVPGHGATATRDEFARYLEMLRATSTAVRASLDKGMSAEAIVEQGLDEEWAPFGEGFVDAPRWIKTIAADS